MFGQTGVYPFDCFFHLKRVAREFLPQRSAVRILRVGRRFFFFIFWMMSLELLRILPAQRVHGAFAGPWQQHVAGLACRWPRAIAVEGMCRLTDCPMCVSFGVYRDLSDPFRPPSISIAAVRNQPRLRSCSTLRCRTRLARQRSGKVVVEFTPRSLRPPRR